VVLIQKLRKTVADAGTDPMDGDSAMRPLCEDAVVGSVVGATSRGDHQSAEHASNVTIRRFVSECLPHICHVSSYSGRVYIGCVVQW